MNEPIINTGGILSQPKAEIILKSYGLNAIKRKFYSLPSGGLKKKEDQYPYVIVEEEDERDAVSRLGTNVFDNIIFKKPYYLVKTAKDNITILTNPNGELIQTTTVDETGNSTLPDAKTQNSNTEIKAQGENEPNAFLINTVLMEVTQTRNVIVTPIAGGNGTIKEYIGDGDYQIKMRGYIESSNPNKYPIEDMNIFKKYLSAPVPLEVVSNYLRIFDIDKIVILDYNFPQTEGRRNLQFFEITAISEKELENGLIIDSNNA
jgi:hypothetical protein